MSSYEAVRRRWGLVFADLFNLNLSEKRGLRTRFAVWGENNIIANLGTRNHKKQKKQFRRCVPDYVPENPTIVSRLSGLVEQFQVFFFLGSALLWGDLLPFREENGKLSRHIPLEPRKTWKSSNFPRPGHGKEPHYSNHLQYMPKETIKTTNAYP